MKTTKEIYIHNQIAQKMTSIKPFLHSLDLPSIGNEQNEIMTKQELEPFVDLKLTKCLRRWIPSRMVQNLPRDNVTNFDKMFQFYTESRGDTIFLQTSHYGCHRSVRINLNVVRTDQ